MVITNPHATAMTPRERDVLTHALGSDAELEVVETANRGHAAALACRAMRNGTDVVVAFGGDGTVNEVVNGLLTDGVHDKVPALGVVPAGSTNVFARALGLPQTPIEATGVGVEKWRNKGKTSSHALYARVGVREFFRSDRRHPRLHVELPDGTRY